MNAQLVGNMPYLATMPSCALYIRPVGSTYKDFSPQRATLGIYGTAPSQSNAQNHFNGGSVLMNAAGSVYSPSSVNFNLGNNWVISCGVYLIALTGGVQMFFSRDNNSSPQLQWYINGDPYQPIFYYNTSLIFTSSQPIMYGVWTHLIVTRIGTTITGYINGSSVGSGVVSNASRTLPFTFGGGGTSALYVNGYMDEMAVWTSDLNSALPTSTQVYNAWNLRRLIV